MKYSDKIYNSKMEKMANYDICFNENDQPRLIIHDGKRTYANLFDGLLMNLTSYEKKVLKAVLDMLLNNVEHSIILMQCKDAIYKELLIEKKSLEIDKGLSDWCYYFGRRNNDVI